MTENYAVELFYEMPPSLPEEELSERLRAMGARVEWMSDAENPRWCSITYPNHAILLPQPATPRCIITTPVAELDIPSYKSALQQSWDWPEADDVVATCRYSALLVDADTSGLHYRQRLEIFEATLTLLVEAVPPRAIYWEPCQKFVNPSTYLAARRPGEGHDPMYGPLNVRMFNVQDRGRPERIMDTVGLAAIGLPDLQCHFAELDPNAIGHLLYEYAYMLIDKGDVIEEGHTVQGLTPDDKWHCRREEALIAPRRPVIDLDPGYPYAGQHRVIEIEV
jgi:hypothetical protein